MKILYVVSRPLEINTSSSLRNIATIKGFTELGHKVDLVTTQYDKNHANYDSSIFNENINVKYIQLGGVQQIAKIGRKTRFLNPLKVLAYRFLSTIEIYDNLKGIVNHVTKLEIKDGTYDLIISSSDPKSSHLFVHRMFELGLINKTPWIQIWGDPFFSDIARNSFFLASKIKNEEKRILAPASKIVYVSDLTLEEQKRLYPNFANKMYYYPIPYLEKNLYPAEEEKDSLTFLYCGDYSSNIRNIMPLYTAIKNTKHKLIICGSSDIKLNSTEAIKVYPRISYNKTKELEFESDVLVHLSNLRGNQIPGKIYHYSGTNKPILFILDGNKEGLLNLFEKYNRYIFCDNNVQAISDTLSKINFHKKAVYNNPVEEFSALSVTKKILNEFS